MNSLAANELTQPPARDRLNYQRIRVPMMVLLLLGLIILALYGTSSVAWANHNPDDLICASDENGANDEPGQKDLTRLCIDYAHTSPTATPTPVSTLFVKWQWDQINWTGANSGDACALFDTDGDGNANYSYCASIGGSPATLDPNYPKLYSCGDAKPDRCTSQNSVIPSPGSSCTISIVNQDPFGAGDAFPQDTQADCTINLNNISNQQPVLLNVCSYPSFTPNSDPSDCVLIQDRGRLIIRKVADPDDPNTEFKFTLNPAAIGGATQFSIFGSGTTSIIPIDPGPSNNPTSYSLSEIVPSNWSLASASCSDGSPLNNIQFSSGEQVTCTFNNTQKADLALTAACPTSWSQGSATHSVTVSNLGPQAPTTTILTVTVPNELNYQGFTEVQSPGGTTSCALATPPNPDPDPLRQDIVCTLTTPYPPGFPQNATWTVNLQLSATIAGNVSIRSQVSSNLPDPDTTTIGHENSDVCTTVTPVTLAYFLADPREGAVHFEWMTATETGNAGFNLYAGPEGDLQRLNHELIPSVNGDSADPQRYSYDAGGLEHTTFYIEDVDVQGNTRLHGPFELGQSYGEIIETEPINWATIRAAADAQAQADAAAAIAAANAQLDAITADGEARAASAVEEDPFTEQFAYIDNGVQDSMVYLPALTTGAPSTSAEVQAVGKPPKSLPTSSLSPDTVVAVAHLRVKETGIYRVTYEDLVAAGFDFTGVDPAALALTNRGVSVPIRVYSQSLFGPGAFIEFYGQGLDTLYTDTNVYVLQVAPALASRVAANTTRVKKASPVPYYMETLRVEEDKTYYRNSMDSDPWLMEQFAVFKTPKTWTYTFMLDNALPDAADGALEVILQGVTSFQATNPDHHIIVAVNGTTVADEFFDGAVKPEIRVTLPPGLLREGSNTITFTLPGDTAATHDYIYLHGFEVEYPRAFAARGGRLEFSASGEAIQVQGLPSNQIIVYRLHSDYPVLVGGTVIEAVNGAYRVTFAGAATLADYWVSTLNELRKPEIVAPPVQNDITSGSAQYLMIAHPLFMADLQPLVDARTSQGYAVRVVNVNDIYSQFGHGIFDAQAIREYIKYAAKHMGTEYVLLVGGDTYDYRDYLGKAAYSFIPSLYVTTSWLAQYAPSDALLADIDGDGYPDLPIGRLPVRTTDELKVAIAKTLVYDTKDYSGTLFAAEKADSVSYAAISEQFISQLPQDWSVERVYLDQMSLADARDRVISTMNRGVALANYIGHSGPQMWSFTYTRTNNRYTYLFTSIDAELLQNAGKPMLVTQWGCWNTYYVSPNFETLGHKLMLSGDRGAAAVLGSATYTEAYSEEQLGRLLMPLMTQPGMTIGDAVLQAKTELAKTNPEMLDVLLGWTLLGDPTLRLNPIQ